MPNILTQHESKNGQEIIVRLSEPYQKTKRDILPIVNCDSGNDEMSEESSKYQEAHRNSEQTVEEWLNKQHVGKEEEDTQNGDDNKMEVKEVIDLRIVFDEDDLNYISPLQRDVLEFLFKEFRI